MGAMYPAMLLAKLNSSAEKLPIAHLKQSALFDYAVSGAATAVTTFGGFLQFNTHLRLIATDGCFQGRGTFIKGHRPTAKDLEDLFRYEVLKMLKAEGKINAGATTAFTFIAGQLSG